LESFDIEFEGISHPTHQERMGIALTTFFLLPFYSSQVQLSKVLGVNADDLDTKTPEVSPP